MTTSRSRNVFEHLDCGRPLAGYHSRIIERMDENGAASLSLPFADDLPLGLFAEDDFCPVAAHRRHLDRRSVVRHHHGAGNPSNPGGVGKGGRMVSRRVRDHPAGGFFVARDSGPC